MSDLTRQQLCAELAVSDSTVRRLQAEGLPHTMVRNRPRYDLAEVKRWLRALREQRAQAEADAQIAAESLAQQTLLAAMSGAFAGAPEPEERAPRMERTALVRYHANKRRAAKLQRTPPWADLDAMRAVYAEANRLTQETGIPHHVDHIVPLQGRLVSGLHVHNNLQILTGSENSKKRNHFEVADE